MSEPLEELASLGKLLIDDARQSQDELIHDSDNQFKRRTLVHFIFACVEGYTFIKKQYALALYEKMRLNPKLTLRNFSERQMAWLKEEAYGQKFPRFEDNFKFSFQAMSTVMGAKFDLNLDRDPMWHSFRIALAIRNRITHPKHIHDMIVSDEEILHVMKAFYWFTEKTRALQDIFLSYVRGLNRIVDANASKGDA